MPTNNKMTTKTKVFIGLGIFILLLIVAGVMAYITTTKESSLASKFVTDISNKRESDAYSQFSTALKEVQDEATFKEQIATLTLDSSCKLEVSGVESSVSTDDGTTKVISGKIKCDSKTLNSVEFTYDDDSLLIGYSIKP